MDFIQLGFIPALLCLLSRQITNHAALYVVTGTTLAQIYLITRKNQGSLAVELTSLDYSRVLHRHRDGQLAECFFREMGRYS